MSTTQSETHLIKCQQDGHCISINEADIQLIGDLRVRRIASGADAEHGYRSDTKYESLLELPPHPLSVKRGELPWFAPPNAGLLPALHVMAHVHKCQLQVAAEIPFSDLPEPQYLSQLNYPSLARFAQKHTHGLIRTTGAFDIAYVAAELAVAYRQKRIIVLGAKIDLLKRMAKTLNEILPPEEFMSAPVQLAYAGHPIILDEDEDGDGLPRVVCSTFEEATEFESVKYDIAILCDACECVYQRARKVLVQPNARFRLYGAIRGNRKLVPHEKGVIGSTFGFHVIDLMNNGRVRRDVHVTMLAVGKPEGQGAINRGSFDYGRDYIANGYRNSQIVRLANMLPKGNPPRKGIEECFQQHGQGPRPVTLLVDRLDHAIALGDRKELSDWQIIAPKGCDLYGLPKSVRTRLKRDSGDCSNVSRQIMLANMAKQFTGHAADVVIWAGGSPGIGAIPDSWLFQKDGEDRPLLIVDFLDQFSRQALKMSEDRRAAYEEQGIFPVGTCATQERILGFIAEHGTEANDG